MDTTIHSEDLMIVDSFFRDMAIDFKNYQTKYNQIITCVLNNAIMDDVIASAIRRNSGLTADRAKRMCEEIGELSKIISLYEKEIRDAEIIRERII